MDNLCDAFVDRPYVCCARRRELGLPRCSSEWPSSPPPPPLESSPSGPAAGCCASTQAEDRQHATARNEWMNAMQCLLVLNVQHVRLTPWPGCEAPRSPPPASDCCPPFPPPPAWASSPPPAASGCSSEGRRRNTPTLTSHWGWKHNLSRKKTFISCRRHSILYYFHFLKYVPFWKG